MSVYSPAEVPPAWIAATSEITHSGELKPRIDTDSNLLNGHN